MLQILHLLLIHPFQNGLKMLPIRHSLLLQHQIIVVVLQINDKTISSLGYSVC
jgi:hypothetical protein